MKTGRPLTFTPETIEQIRVLAVEGMRAKEIAAKIGRHYKGVWDLMNRMKMPKQARNCFPKLDANPSWKGGRHLDADGYVMIHAPEHPNARGKGFVREHRLVMEQQLGRLLLPSEVVHHRDGNKANNSPDNLELFATNADHLKHSLKGKVPKWTPEGKARMTGRKKG